MGALDLDHVRRALAEPAREIAVGGEARRAAVAAILRPSAADVEVLLIRRAERADDPWSGHMAFPGGRHDAGDRDLQATAVRETREEVGLDLEAHGEAIGRLDDVVPGGSRGVLSGLVVSPFVFVVPEPPGLVPNGVEVDAIHWTPLAPMLRGERDAVQPYVWRGQPMQFPGYRVEEREGSPIVWGMTHRMLEMLFARVRRVLEQK